MKYGLIALLLIPTLASARIDAKVNEDGCKIVAIHYDEIHNYVEAVGGCQVLFDMCTEDFCSVKKIEAKELNFGQENLSNK
jgi:hypothetical protein